MFAGVKAAAVHHPTTLAELSALRSRLPQALLWAGGTDIMSRSRPYPASDGIDIIYLGGVPELTRISRSERYIEIGAMVSIEETLTVGQHILHPVLSLACRSLAPYVIRSQATFGGSLGVPDLQLNIPAALAVLEAQVEVRNPNGKKAGAQWVPVHRMFSRTGVRTVQPPAFITRIRIPLEESSFDFFQSVGEPYSKPDEAVILAVFSVFGQQSVTTFRFALTFPRCGIFRSRELETAVPGNDLPFSHRDIHRLLRILQDELTDSQFSLSPLQRERASRVFELCLHRMNSRSLMMK